MSVFKYLRFYGLHVIFISVQSYLFGLVSSNFIEIIYLKKTKLVDMNTCRKPAVNIWVKYSNIHLRVCPALPCLYTKIIVEFIQSQAETSLIFYPNIAYAQVYAVGSFLLFQLRQNSVLIKLLQLISSVIQNNFCIYWPLHSISNMIRNVLFFFFFSFLSGVPLASIYPHFVVISLFNWTWAYSED